MNLRCPYRSPILNEPLQHPLITNSVLLSEWSPSPPSLSTTSLSMTLSPSYKVWVWLLNSTTSPSLLILSILYSLVGSPSLSLTSPLPKSVTTLPYTPLDYASTMLILLLLHSLLISSTEVNASSATTTIE